MCLVNIVRDVVHPGPTQTLFEAGGCAIHDVSYTHAMSK